VKRLLISVCALASVAGSQSGRVLVEVKADRSRYFVQQVVRVTLRVRVERSFLEKNLIQPFRRELQLPLRVDAQWLDRLPHAAILPTTKGAPVLVVNGKLATARRIDDGTQSLVVFELVRSYLPERPGTLSLAAPRVRYSYATKFRDDFLNGRLPDDRHEGDAVGPKLELDVAVLPDGAPTEFTGAVGRFTVRADAAPRELRAGESLKLSVTIEGKGNLMQFAPPSLAELDGFHVRGSVEASDANQRTIVYDLAALRSDVHQVPPISFAFFDPGPPPGYLTLHTRAIAIKVSGTTAAIVEPVRSTPERRPIAGVNDIFGIRTSHAAEPNKLSVGAVAVAITSPWLLAVLAFGLWRYAEQRRRRGPPPPDGVALFRKRAKTAGVRTAFVEFLAARLACPAAAVIGPELSKRLANAGVDNESARQADALTGELVAELYGGTHGNRSTEAATLVAKLDAAWRETP
jgi:hypothetical protein